DLQITANVVRRQLFDVARIFHGNVVTHAGGDQDLLDAFQVTGATVKVDRRLVVGVHMLANARIDAGETTTGLLSARRFAAQHVHVSRWTTQIGDYAGKARDRVANRFDLVNNRLFGTALNNTTFVFGDRTEGAPAEAAAHDVDREADHLVRRNTAVAI